MSPRRHFPARGTVSLVALCFVAVLGIVLASYLTLCSRAMNLSNRSFQAGVAQQLAEFGLEEGLRAFNRNDWSGWAGNPGNVTGGTTAWTLDPANQRASRTLTFNPGKLGQGVTATVKIRIDNYDAAQLDATWSSNATYRVNDLVGYNGTWYRCVQNHSSSQIPSGIGNLSYWVPAPISSTWVSGQSYDVQDMVFYNGRWRRCLALHTSSAAILPTNASYWVSIPNISATVNGSTWYTTNEVAYYGSPYNTWVHRTSSGWGSDASGWDYAPISWRWDSSKTYNYNDVVYYNATWYRYIRGTASSGVPTTNTDYWENALTGMWAWGSGSLKYNLGDAVYSNNLWYRCTLAHTSSSALAPGSAGGAAYWSSAPLFSTAWDSGRQYGVNDTVSYNGVWYRCKVASTLNAPTNTTDWASAANAVNSWSATTSYTANTSYVSYGGVWYKCIGSNTGQSPNNTGYWTAAWKNSWQPNSADVMGAPVVLAEATVLIAGNPSIRTQLRAAINLAPLLPNALAASTTVQVTGGGTIDSYDSNAGAYGGANVGYSAVVAAGNTGSTAVSLTSTVVKGYLAAPSAATPPYGPLVSSGGTLKNPDGSVTSYASNLNLDLTRISRSPTIPQFDTVPGGAGGLAATWGSTPKATALLTAPSPAAAVNIGTPGATTPARYYCASLTIDGSAITSLNINGPVILYVQGNLVMGGGTPNTMTINSTGSAEIHVGGNVNINQTSGGIVNVTRDPRKAVIICDSSAAGTLNYSDGDNDFYGVIYAPYTTSSSGFAVDNSSVVIFGAVSARKISYAADANVHYDTALRSNPIPGVDQPYAVTDWRILPQTEQATMP